MIILRDGDRINDPRVVALGTFDGVHLGHKALLERGKTIATEKGYLLRAQTFDRHPLEVLFPEKAPLLLTDDREKESLMEEAGVDELRILSFTEKTAGTEPLSFLEALCAESAVRTIVVGWNYTFGKRGAGTTDLLRECQTRFGYRLEVVPPVRMNDGEIISSSAIRNKLSEGDFQRASDMLGYGYLISGEIVSGKGLGKQIGVPTANLRTNRRKMYPKFGVYSCFAEWDGETHPAVVNIGAQPTAPSGEITTEVHMLDGERNLYGKQVTLSLCSRIRDEIRFESLDALTRRIERDKEEAMDSLHLRPYR